ncbi:hypothetical protein MBM_06322 [Drepanopeziza brunnea f. sp. 'multigermtubi' MB_m1]|uniref:Uncharacterized protein n=1 Tax=Marssonina brunnea f. sp. multigermtubi (strain MB_m1) TaxID=1072389 RepID=K1XT89_MARBU|nr:uncharacterized protein MBM_06322 [Drepanopeziza brunnea f. sp. 'multigermtubi' MB_m1]EKD15694.1 hypothetical protein MBM_06322 [Drepanopeziza brunnea f. sp. 'multigermtubi' MB_m1]
MSTKQAVSLPQVTVPTFLKAVTGLGSPPVSLEGSGAVYQVIALFQEAEGLLEAWKHPDPYHAPTAPGGSKFERNLPAPILTPPTEFVK